ncbi:hypothetical protein GGTG_13939 [Gaeumannomyces tritici R3-111a-1]|uniref:Uncharacterized protein n=1 Tax=Gaeumannomyces tritici (strain R3-111a-1) TaxID=644352 RepID=J3PK90_GAET3|nr:hypothetical protein GGTG_13939 [Gaeumannomyces tritici R3-111a-1]EJT68487.1 hypothetical protein GGTG_13939 [Gaeumannomyces tritici R3-111a-1]
MDEVATQGSSLARLATAYPNQIRLDSHVEEAAAKARLRAPRSPAALSLLPTPPPATVTSGDNG